MQKQAIETRFLRHVDNLAARVLQKLDQRGLKGLTRDDRMDWIRFLMSLRLRQPNVVLQLREESADYLRKRLADEPEQYESLITNEDPPTLEEWTEQKYPGLIENFGLSFFLELVNDIRIGTKVLRMKWWLWDFSKVRYALLLADCLCIFTTGIDDPNLVIALPISPKKAFMATQSDHMAVIMRQQEPKHLAARMNESSLHQARARIYACNTASERFIRNRLWKRGKR